MNVFTHAKIIARDAAGVHVAYKLWDTPYTVDDIWYGLGDLKSDMTELTFPFNHCRSVGIQLRFIDSGTREPTFKLEKMLIYSYGETQENSEQN
jgi:hypothetical protein